MSADQSSQQQVQIKIMDDIIKGVYSNVMEVKSSREEFCLDFFNVFPPVGAVTARIIISPGHLKRMIKVLQNSIDLYEKKFGNVEEAEEPASTLGFKA